jgi:hypothetical protein
LRIVVAGSSASLFVTPQRTSRAEGNYGELLPGRLAASGVAAEVFHTGRWFGMICDARRGYEDMVRNLFPDVLVLNFGTAEYQPRVVPLRVVRHLQTWDQGLSVPARAYRRHLAPILWRSARQLQRLGARAVGQRTHRLSPRRFVAEFDRVIEMVRADVRPLVLIVDMDPPGPRVEHWIPGMTRRHAHYQQLLEEAARRWARDHDGEVRLVRASRTIDGPGAEVVIPDGLHRSATGHRLTADLLAGEILDWLGRAS